MDRACKAAPRLVQVAAVAFGLGTASSQTVIPVITDLIPAFGFGQGVSPRSFARLSGTNLVDAPGLGAGQVKVFVNGIAALIDSRGCVSTPDCIFFQVPPQTLPGPATFTVANGPVSSAPFSFAISQYAPNPSSVTFHLDGTAITVSAPARPGERIHWQVSGLGAVDPPPLPAITFGGFAAGLESLQDSGPPVNFPGVYTMTFTVPPSLGSGSYSLTVSVAGITSPTVFVPVASTGLNVSQTGVTFRAVAGSTSALQRSISIISTSAPINWIATASTVSGGNWLQVTPAQGTSDPVLNPPSIVITASASNLTPGDYYGTVSIRSSTVSQVISVVLNVTPPAQSPGPLVEPTGAVFAGSPGGPAPSAKIIQITNPATVPVTFTSSATSSTVAPWFHFQPASGTVTPGQPTSISVQPNAGLAAGTFTGAITFSFSDGSIQVVNLLDVMAAGASGGSLAARDLPNAATACTPTKLLPVFTLLGVNFTSPVAWPANIEAFILDDCGAVAISGSAVVGFSNSDPPVPLVSLKNGRWTGTWTPRHAVTTNLVATLNVQSLSLALKGSAMVSGASPPNPNVPIISSGGIVGTATYVSSPAPGTLISLFGIALADVPSSASQLPLPSQLSTTRMILGGATVPLLFVGENQINAQVPYKLTTKATYSVIVQRGTAISTPETISIQDAQPAVFSTDGSGTGQGHIYRIAPSGAQILAAPSDPVAAGDVLTIYCAGLGEVTPPLDAGVAAPPDTLENTASQVTATVGGVSARVLFAGLTPGSTGLYQVNLIMPSGVTPGSAVPLVLTAGGQVSLPATLAVK